MKNPKKDLNGLGEEEDDSEKDHNDLEDDSEEDGLDDVMEKSGLGFQPKKLSVRPVIQQLRQLPAFYRNSVEQICQTYLEDS